ncbi:MAG TPA: transcriptional repressor [Thiolapillus brandeum]|uniref:Ferric uptake regulation protein n=1 Tax=Thiolapillus brandeum TaxID=1076588 RepID=A0A7C5N335_9GAMM|nr:transcriptional repressor [Thiolapillus brandeum]
MDSVRQLLDSAGIYATPQRLAIGEVLFVGPQHLTADEIYDRVRSRNGGVSRATVYNTLNLFTEKGLLREIFVDAACAFYDTNTRPHYHLYNVDTGELQDMEDDHILEHFARSLPAGTRLKGVDVVVRVGNHG